MERISLSSDCKGHPASVRRLRPLGFDVRDAVVYGLAFLIVLFFVIATWYAFPGTLEMGRDAKLTEWLAQKNFAWNSAFGVTTLNPFQGAGSMMMPVNPWWIPANWLIMVDLPATAKLILSETIYFTEVFVAIFVLTTGFGFPSAAAFASAVLVCLLLFPPFNFFFGLQGWVATVRFYAHSAALSCLIYLAFMKLGTVRAHTFREALIRNSLIAATIVVLVYLFILPAPFWNSGLLLGVGIGGACIGLASRSWRVLAWRAAAATVVVTWVIATGILGFLMSAKNISARFLGVSGSDSWINWSALDGLPPVDRIMNSLCAWGVMCKASLNPIFGISSYWLDLAIIIGCIQVALLGFSRQTRWFAATLCVVWVVLKIYWMLAVIGLFRTGLFAPLYYYFALYPLLGMMAASGAMLRLRTIRRRIRRFATWGWLGRVGVRSQSVAAAGLCVAALAGVSFNLGSGPQMERLLKANLASLNRQEQAIWPSERPSSPSILEKIRTKIALEPGIVFQGTVASVFGVPGGGMRRDIGRIPDQAPVLPGQFEQYRRFVYSELGNALMLMDLWEFDIPTLEEYGQAITLPLRLYAKNFLSRPGDATEPHFVLVRKIDVPVLESLGVRFVLTDAPLTVDQGMLRYSIRITDTTTLYLFELHDPNRGNHSPTTLRVITSAKEVINALLEDSKRLKREAMVAGKVNVGALRPATRSKFLFTRRGALLEAESIGQSAILLPMQYSRCLKVRTKGPGTVIEVTRANLIHTLVVFSGRVTVDFHWQFDFFGHHRCRKRDLVDLERLGVFEALRGP